MAAAANDVIYYGLIFRLPSDVALSQRVGSKKGRSSRYLAVECSAQTRSVFGGWLNIWLGGRKDGWSVSWLVGWFLWSPLLCEQISFVPFFIACFACGSFSRLHVRLEQLN